MNWCCTVFKFNHCRELEPERRGPHEASPICGMPVPHYSVHKATYVTYNMATYVSLCNGQVRPLVSQFCHLYKCICVVATYANVLKAA
eukprot:1158930-Pelagomonas_calceolata.AAC.3